MKYEGGTYAGGVVCFGATLREWRKHMGVKRAVRLAAAGRRGFSQADAARWLGVPKRTYEGWERASGAKVPQRLVMEMLLKRIRGSY